MVNDAVNNFFRTIVGEPLKHIDFSESYTATYRCQPRERVAMGITAGVATSNSYKNHWLESLSSYKINSYILAWEAKFNYVTKQRLNLYYTIGVGGVVVSEKDLNKLYNQTRAYGYPTCQITPFGIRYGKKSVPLLNWDMATKAS